jgi:hypothetical protein
MYFSGGEASADFPWLLILLVNFRGVLVYFGEASAGSCASFDP